MSGKLKNRIEQYQNDYDFKLTNRIPICIILNGKNFSKITQLLDKPFCSQFSDCMLSTTLKLCYEVEGAIFAFQHNDEIVLIARNDQHIDTNPWCDNKVQKICSITSSIASLHLNQQLSQIPNYNIMGDTIFTSQIFLIPSVSEVINTVIFKQQQNFHTSIQYACLYELIKKYDKNTIKEMLTGLSIDEKVDLLLQECQIDFNDYPILFRRGSACYKVPKIINDVMKNKWEINSDLPIFTKDQSFLDNILKMGHDIIRNNNGIQ